MKSKKAYSRFNQPKRILSKQEYEEYKNQIIARKKAELQEQIKSGRKNLKTFQAQQRFKESKTGRLGQTIKKGLEAVTPVRMIYKKKKPVKPANIQRRISPQQMQQIQQQRLIQAQRNRQEDNHRAWAFSDMRNPQFDQVSIVEREINNSQGHANVGDIEAIQMSNLANPFNVFNAVERETNITANIQHQRPIFNMGKEIDFFSNLVP